MTENTNSQKVSSEDSKSNEDHYSDAKGENTDDDDNSSNASSEYEVVSSILNVFIICHSKFSIHQN